MEEEEDKEEEEEEEEKQSRPQMPPSPKKEKHIGPGEQVAPTPCSPVSACPGAAFSPTLGCRQSHEFWFYLPLPSTCLSPGESRGVRSLGLNKVLRQCDLFVSSVAHKFQGLLSWQLTSQGGSPRHVSSGVSPAHSAVWVAGIRKWETSRVAETPFPLT